MNSNSHSTRANPFYLARIILMALGLFIGSLFLMEKSSGQIQIADENTELPDYQAYETGLDAAYAGDYDTALREFTKAADAGLHLAQYNLGVMYFSGTGVPQDYALAYQWTRQAAEQGHINAQYNLGTLYYNGRGMRSALFSYWPLSLIYQQDNFKQAASWYAQAAEYDHGEAQFALASMYLHGHGVDRNVVTALMWARLAHDNEVPAAASILQTLEGLATAQQQDQAGREYASWVLAHR